MDGTPASMYTAGTFAGLKTLELETLHPKP